MSNYTPDFMNMFKQPVEVETLDVEQNSSSAENKIKATSQSTYVGRGRPKVEKRRKSFTFSLTDETREKLNVIAHENKTSSSKILSKLIDDLYEEHLSNGGRPYDTGEKKSISLDI